MWLFWGAIFEFFVQIWVNLSDFEWRFIKFSYHSLMKTTRENPAFLKEQIITYLGNKRALLGFIASGVEYAKSELKKDKVSFLDMFSGSGVVSRFAKGFASFIVANDLEDYAYIISKCYLANVDKAKFQGLCELYEHLKLSENELQKGFLSTLYAPKDEKRRI